jgi:hypothetical protein
LISVDLPDPDGPADDDHLALLDLGRAIDEHLELAVPLGDVVDRDHRHGEFLNE